MEFRPFYMAREWVRQGHDVEIVASSFSHVRGKQPEMKGTYTEQNIEGVRYLWCATKSYQGNGVARVKNIFSFLWRVWNTRSRWRGENKPDAVIASSTYPLDIFVAWWIARRSGAKLVFEVHDLWPLSPIELGGMSKWHPFIMLLQFAEDFAYRVSDQVISMLPLAAEYMCSRGLDQKKFFHIPNGIDLDEWRAPDIKDVPRDLQAWIHSDRQAGRFTVAYVGAHGIANALDSLLEAAALLKSENISFYLVGPGPEKANLKAMAERLHLTNVRFYDSVPKLAVPALLQEFDLLYIGLQNQSLFRFGISPNKLMDYMAAGKPIINAIAAGNDPVKSAGCGVTVPSENPAVLAESIYKMSQIPATERHRLGENGKNYVTQHHSYQRLAQVFLEQLSTRDAMGVGVYSQARPD